MNNSRNFSVTRWSLILAFLFITVVSNFIYTGMAKEIIPIVNVLCLFIAASLHGNERYGFKNIVIFIAITWIVSHFFEALSIQTGFPFGHYYYDKLAGPRIFEVPLIIMLGYFGTGYASWISAHIILQQYQHKLRGKRIFLIPFLATFIMVMWDVCMDPLSSTIDSLWVWRDGGPYFGVPLSNYFGWFLVVYILFQLFAIYISKYDVDKTEKIRIFNSKIFWSEAVALYFTQGLSQLVTPFVLTDHNDIYSCMALLTLFSMIFVSLISCIVLNARKTG
jgi:uncharacterized membrane protein